MLECQVFTILFIAVNTAYLVGLSKKKGSFLIILAVRDAYKTYISEGAAGGYLASGFGASQVG